MPKVFSENVVGWENNITWANPLHITMDASQLLPYEIGATLLAHWAFPKSEDENRRKLATLALCRKSLEQRYLKSPELAVRPAIIKPAHVLIPEKDTLKALRTYDRRARDRIYAMQILYDLRYDPLHSVKSKSKLFEDWAKAKKLQLDPTNISSRIWNPSIPVSHITFALVEMQKLFPNRGINMFYVGHSYCDIVIFLMLVSKGAEKLISRSLQFCNLTSIRLINLERNVDWIPDIWEIDSVSEMIKRFGLI